MRQGHAQLSFERREASPPSVDQERSGSVHSEAYMNLRVRQGEHMGEIGGIGHFGFPNITIEKS